MAYSRNKKHSSYLFVEDLAFICILFSFFGFILRFLCLMINNTSSIMINNPTAMHITAMSIVFSDEPSDSDT